MTDTGHDSGGKESNPAAALVTSITRILQAGLEAHESIERHTRVSVVHELSEWIGFRPGVVPFDELATLLFAYAVFGRPLSRNQQRMQEAILARLVEADDGLLYRQVQGEPLRGWHYVPQRNGRAVAYPLAGPRRGREELFDVAVAIDTGETLGVTDGLAWTATVPGRHVLLVARPLGAASIEALTRLRPFPQPSEEQPFWDDQIEVILALALDPDGRLARQGDDESLPTDAFRDGQRLPTVPAEQPRELLERVVLCAGFDATQRRNDWYGVKLQRRRWPRELIATARVPEDLESLDQIFQSLRYRLLGWAVQGRFTGPTDPALEAWLPLERIFAAFGVEKGQVPSADPGLLMSHPLAVLRLQEETSVCAEVHPLDAIRVAVAWSRATLGDEHPEHAALLRAFEAYRTERRWIATWDAFALDDTEHIERIDYAEIVHGLRTVFEAAVLQVPIDALGLEVRHLTRLEAALRPKPWGPENIVRVGDLPMDEAGVLRLRSIGPSILTQLKTSLLGLARGWRAHESGLDARALGPAGARASTHRQALQDGLDELAALFDETEDPS